MQGVRWQIEHIEFWYETSSCTLLRVLLMFSPPSQLFWPLRWLWIAFFSLTLYPLFVMVALTLAVGTVAVIVSFALILSVLLPFVSLCTGNNMDLFPNSILREQFGCCVSLIIVILLYPLFYILDLVQIAY
jgi:hypothetical protein